MKRDEVKTLSDVNKVTDDDFMLSATILKNAAFTDKQLKSKTNKVIEPFAKLFLEHIPFWICFLLIGVVARGGLIVDLIIIICIFASYTYFMPFESYTKFQMICWGSFGNRDVAENTLREAKWLVPALEKCEKEKDAKIKKELYLDLIKRMDDLYGELNHALVAPISEKEKDEIRGELKGWDYLKKAINKYEEHFQQFVASITYSEPIPSNEPWNRNYCPWYKGTHGFAVDMECPNYWNENKDVRQSIDKITKKIAGKTLTSIKDYTGDIGLATLADLRLQKSRFYEEFGINPRDYYSVNDVTCLEGKITFELLSEVQKHSKTKINWLKELSEEKYHQLCKAAKENGYSEYDILDDCFRVKKLLEQDQLLCYSLNRGKEWVKQVSHNYRWR